jgi:hypothetical protein
MPTDRKKNEVLANRQTFIRGSDARIIMGDDESPLLRFWRDICAKIEGKDPPLGVASNHPKRRWYEAITGRMPIGWNVVAVSCATAAILLGWWPWNFLLLLLLFPIRNNRVRFCVFRTSRSNGPMEARVFCTRGSSL